MPELFTLALIGSAFLLVAGVVEGVRWLRKRARDRRDAWGAEDGHSPWFT